MAGPFLERWCRVGYNQIFRFLSTASSFSGLAVTKLAPDGYSFAKEMSVSWYNEKI
jgi:hypothetical protein